MGCASRRHPGVMRRHQNYRLPHHHDGAAKSRIRQGLSVRRVTNESRRQRTRRAGAIEKAAGVHGELRLFVRRHGDGQGAFEVQQALSESLLFLIVARIEVEQPGGARRAAADDPRPLYVGVHRRFEGRLRGGKLREVGEGEQLRIVLQNLLDADRMIRAEGIESGEEEGEVPTAAVMDQVFRQVQPGLSHPEVPLVHIHGERSVSHAAEAQFCLGHIHEKPRVRDACQVGECA